MRLTLSDFSRRPQLAGEGTMSGKHATAQGVGLGGCGQMKTEGGEAAPSDGLGFHMPRSDSFPFSSFFHTEGLESGGPMDALIPGEYAEAVNHMKYAYVATLLVVPVPSWMQATPFCPPLTPP
jgi:hypothetical protein